MCWFRCFLIKEKAFVAVLEWIWHLLHTHILQMQLPEVFYRNFVKFTGKHLYQSLFFNKVAGLRCFPVSFAKFLRTGFTEHLRTTASDFFTILQINMSKSVFSSTQCMLNAWRFSVNPFMTEAVIIKKPVHWFAEQINVLVSIW